MYELQTSSGHAVKSQRKLLMQYVFFLYCMHMYVISKCLLFILFYNVCIKSCADSRYWITIVNIQNGKNYVVNKMADAIIRQSFKKREP